MYCEAFNSWILQLEFTKHLTTTGGFHLSIMFRNSARWVIKFNIKKAKQNGKKTYQKKSV